MDQDERSRRTTTWREDLVTALLATWPVTGLYLDGWAHHTRPEMESFFTPWHGVLYSGAGVFGGWLLFLVARRRRSASAGTWRGAIPAGYGLGVLGLLGFALAGFSDMAWHQIFGVEVSLDALLSPSHLLLLASALLVLTSPLRAAWLRTGAADPEGRRHDLWPAILSLTLTTAIVAFFLHYLSPFEQVGLVASADEGDAILALASIFVTNVMLVAPLVLFIRRFGAPPFGAATLLFTGVILLLEFGHDFPLPAMILAGLAAGLIVDLLLRVLSPSASRERTPWLAGALVPLPLWGAYFLVVALTTGIGWKVEVWTGALVMTAIAGFGLGLLAAPPEVDGRQTTRAA